jgi:hypothetical protein
MAISHIQDGTATYASATSFSTAFPGNNTSGNLIIALAQWADNTSTPTISDTLLSSWTQVFFQNNSFGSQSWALWYALAPSTGANTVQVDISGSAVLGAVALCEFSGVDSLDLNTAQADGSGTTMTSNSGATAYNDELLLGSIGNTGGTVTGSGGYTDGGQMLFAGIAYVELAWKIVSSTGTYSASGTAGGSGNWSAQLSSFYLAAAPPASTQPLCFILG